ncbi:sulfite exporter TauE/SafE family protein [Edwardsiella tarda]
MSLGIIALLCLCGALTSLLSALFGLGGGIVLVPVLHVLFPACEVQLLAATSLSVVMLTALINVLAFWRQQLRPDPRLLIGWALAVSAGMQLGVHISFLLPGRAILLIFAAILLLMAWRNLRCAASSTTTVMSSPRTRNYGIGLCLAGARSRVLPAWGRVGAGAVTGPVAFDSTSTYRPVLQLVAAAG